jgi:hypothetical protein
MFDRNTVLSLIVSLPGIAALLWLWRVVIGNERRRKHDRQLIERASRRINSHERSLAKIEQREPYFLHPIYDEQDAEENPY